ncbi:hypothetical protein [Streptomyces halobius]|uniref:Uncharacterized protein n=1 Tax=Streptomyces halobius TaxID=2879846 RepID=A0ABY4MH69_9ACTN|nr:hypothetical protein [Streptomyces halobius]UQA97073.1 hypothetical protein K9S39_39020 [Streptomyces halobius]
MYPTVPTGGRRHGAAAGRDAPLRPPVGHDRGEASEDPSEQAAAVAAIPVTAKAVMAVMAVAAMPAMSVAAVPARQSW